jgi:hypothetical protein
VHLDVLAGLAACGFEADRVVIGENLAMPHGNPATAIDIDAVVVVIDPAVDGDVFDGGVLAVEEVDRPSGGVSENEAAQFKFLSS